MLVTYLDDSGKDKENPITALGGYAASDDAWAAFETAAEPIFQEYIGDKPLHAKDLYHGDDIYEGWKVVKKQGFVAKLCMQLYPLRPILGVSFGVLKNSYKERAEQAETLGLRKRTSTGYTFCASVLVDWILRDVQVGKMAIEKGLAVILESGNEHNEEAKISLDEIKRIHGLTQVRSMSFVSKEECRAIQMADLFAFYTRRHNRKFMTDGKEPEPDPVLKVLVENLRQRSYVATDFGRDIKASRFFAGDPE